MRRIGVLVIMVTLAATGCSSNGGGSGGRSSAPRLRFVSQNILHGSACPRATNGCELPARIALFVKQIADADCPEVVGLQETNRRSVALLRTELAKICEGRYQIVFDDDPGNDREVVLTTLRVIGSRRDPLAGPLRTVFWVRLAATVGVVDFVTTHLASSSDDRPCDRETCPPPCRDADKLNACQARQTLALVGKLARPDSVIVIGGDFNAQPQEPTIAAFRDAHFVDSHLAAGNAECNPTTGDQCTSGRIDDALTDLKDPHSRETERIDYLFVGGTRGCDVAAPTGLFNAKPAVDGPAGLAFPSDHTAVQATVACPTTDAQRASANDAPLPATSTTTTPRGRSDPATTAAITRVFKTLFDGNITDVNAKLAALEDAVDLKPFFLDSYESTKAIAARIRVRMDRITVTDADHATVVYTLLLDGAAVLDHLPGAAVRIGGTWFVSRRTYCDVSTQGAKEIPTPCRN
jgi:endonuclease/exonuclease/phosphatase family metal-dependent hydrolase